MYPEKFVVEKFFWSKIFFLGLSNLKKKMDFFDFLKNFLLLSYEVFNADSKNQTSSTWKLASFCDIASLKLKLFRNFAP